MSKIDPSKLGDAEFAELETKVAREKESREKKRKERALAENHASLDKLRDLPLQTLLEVFEHDRTSCSDENVSNGWWSNENEFPRCAKCALIETIKGTFPTEKVIKFSLTVSVEDP